MLKRITIKPIPIQTKIKLILKITTQRMVKNHQMEAISLKERNQIVIKNHKKEAINQKETNLRMLKNHQKEEISQKERNDLDKCHYKLFMLKKPCFNKLFKKTHYGLISRPLNYFIHFKFLFSFFFCFSNIFGVVGDNENQK
jgi:hypothetical protein